MSSLGDQLGNFAESLITQSRNSSVAGHPSTHLRNILRELLHNETRRSLASDRRIKPK